MSGRDRLCGSYGSRCIDRALRRYTGDGFHAAAMALKNVMGLVCDPVGGLVECPCVKRNAIGAANAVVSCDMALAGITSLIPFDEVVDAMKAVGNQMHPGSAGDGQRRTGSNANRKGTGRKAPSIEDDQFQGLEKDTDD